MSFYLAAAGPAALGAGYWGAPLLARWMGERRLRRLCAAARTLVLTYDDGPSDITTPRLLDLLGGAGARATFFPLGRRVSRRPEIARRLRAEGHEVGCHSDQHLHAWKTAPWVAGADLRRGKSVLEEVVGPVGLLRPPYGKTNAWTWWTIRRLALEAAWWTLDSGDTRSELPTPDAVVRGVVEAGGGVVLLHDLDREPARDAFVLQTTTALLDAASSEGLGVVTLGELLAGTTSDR